MFNSIRRRGAALGMAALAMLGLGQNANSVATPPTPRPGTKKQARQITRGPTQRLRLRGWTRARDLLPQYIQDARLAAAIEKRDRKGFVRRCNMGSTIDGLLDSGVARARVAASHRGWMD